MSIPANHQWSRLCFIYSTNFLCQLEDIKVNEKSLAELLQETNHDLESVLANLDNLVVTQHTRD